MILLVGLGSLAVFSYLAFWGQSRSRALEPAGTPPEYAFSITGQKGSFLRRPLGVVVSKGQVYVTDSGGGRLQIFTRQGKLVKVVRPAPQVKDAYPMSLTADERGRVYLSVTVGLVNKIMVFDKAGKFLYLFPDEFLTRYKPSPLKRPLGLFFKNGLLYVTDIADHTVKIFDEQGKFLMKMGGAGTGKGQLSYPYAVAADDQGNVYVADSNNSRVQVFDLSGNFLYFFKPGKGDPFALPRGIAIDGRERVLVTDTFRNRILVFDKRGDFLFGFGAPGTGDGGLSYPNGIAVDKDTGLVFIADRQKNRIAVWQ